MKGPMLVISTVIIATASLIVLTKLAKSIIYKREFELFKASFSFNLIMNKNLLFSQKQFNKTYDTPSDEIKRFNTYKSNRQLIDDHNKKFAKHLETFELAVNEYADLLPSEFYKIMNGFIQPKNETIVTVKAAFMGYHTLPSTFDWSENDNSFFFLK